MNHSIYSADRTTHLKILVVALLLATIVAGLSLSLHTDSKTAPAFSTVVLKAGKPVAVSTSTITLLK
jgi:hypothetical protein